MTNVKVVLTSMFLLSVVLLLVSPVAVFGQSTGTGTITYLSSCGSTTTTWTGATASDGNVPGLFTNNVGGPPTTAVVGTKGDSICISISLSGAAPSTTYTFTSNKLSGSLSITTDATGSGSGMAVFTSTFSGSCTTVPITMSPTTNYDLTHDQVAHVFVGGTGSPCSPIVTPEFPLGAVLAVLAPLAAIGLYFGSKKGFKFF